MPMADLASPASDQGVKMAADDSGPNLYKELMNRFLNLEARHSKLREEVEELLQEKRNNEVATSDSGESTSDSVHGFIPGFFSDGSPFRSILESVGHAVHVCSASSGEITCWNRAAENLYGWRDYEVLGQRAVELLVVEEYQNSVENITKHLASGKSWSGQIPVRRKCGDVLLAMVTKSALYEHNELAGIITVSSDAAIFNSIASENLRSTYQDCGRVRGSNSKRIQWHPPLPQIGPVPQIASSVSNLASKLLHRRNGDDTYNPCSSSRGEKDATDAEDLKPEKYSATDAPNPHNGKWTSEGRSSWKDERAAINFVKPSKIADKVLAKLKIKGGSNFGNEADGSIHQNGASHASVSNEKSNKPNSSGDLKESVSGRYPVVSEKKERSDSKKEFNFTAKSASERRLANSSEESCALASLREEGQIFPALPRGRESLARSECQGPNEIERDGKQFSSGESIASHGSSSSKGDNESNLAGSCEICWEDLVLGEEIGQGSYAVVYRGFWNGSEVAVKVYIGNEYNEETLQNYQKETEIMKKLRHPNVLLFMGAVFSQKRLAMVTEFLPRGSLFKTLHKNNQSLDIRRRLRMALDVAKGMNYLHRRNPPIVHRDLKSSNLLVDRNWTVKVGDFGLSKWKDATYLTTKSGRGTPQWMAPEVLRNEPSNEKSDVFSFGVILWELVTASIPWKNLNPLEVVGVVGFMDRRLEVPERVNPRVASIIRDCWHSDPSQRPSFEEIIRRLSGLFQKANTVPKSPDGLQCNGDKLQD